MNWAMSGPTLRGSGARFDIRKVEPYSGYDKYDFDIEKKRIVNINEGDIFYKFVSITERINIPYMTDGVIPVEDNENIRMKPRTNNAENTQPTPKFVRVGAVGW